MMSVVPGVGVTGTRYPVELPNQDLSTALTF